MLLSHMTIFEKTAFYRVKVTDEVLAKLNMSKPKGIIHRDKILFMIYVKTNNGNTLHMCTNILCRGVGCQESGLELRTAALQ